MKLYIWSITFPSLGPLRDFQRGGNQWSRSSHGSLASAQPESVSDLIFHLLATLIVSLFIACAASTTDSGVLDPGPIKEAQVVRVIDGDTLDVLIVGTKHRVRLFGVNTPERGERCYEAATERTRHLSGDMVRVEPGPRSEDRYGRSLFYLYTGSGESIDATLIQEGLATAWTRDGQYRDLLVNLEQEARRQGTGCLW